MIPPPDPDPPSGSRSESSPEPSGIRSSGPSGEDAAESGLNASPAGPAAESPAPDDPQAERGWIAAAVRRPVAVLMAVSAAVVFGWVSYHRLSLNLMPSISYPSITLRTEVPGAAPEEVESLVARPIEQALGIVSGLVNLTTISRAEVCDAVLEFEWDTPMSSATQEIREKLDTINLPREAKRPLILRYDPQLDPILRLGLSSRSPAAGDAAREGTATRPPTYDLIALRKLGEDEIRRDLETVPGVAAVKVRGGLEEEIRVEVNETALISLNLTIDEIHQRLQRENVNLAGGMLREGETEYLVRTLNEFRSLEEISDLTVAQRNGVEIRLRDVGRVLRTHRERTVYTRVNGTDSVEIDIFREADANLVAVADAVRSRIFGAPPPAWSKWIRLSGGDGKDAKDGKKIDAGPRPLVEKLPTGVGIDVLADQSTFVRSALEEVRGTAIDGGILAVVILFLFLRKMRPTLIVGIAIPLSIVATFGLMHLFGVHLNVMSLGGLALGVGMMVDNSIVVLESVDRRSSAGEAPLLAAIRGTREVAAAVVASTLTTVVVFLPIAFVEGVAGQVFRDQALTVVFSLVSSLAVALWFVPTIVARRLGSAGGDPGPRTWRQWMDFPRCHQPLRQAWRDRKAALEAGEGVALLTLEVGWLALRFPVDAVLDLLRVILVLAVLVSLAGASMLVRGIIRLIEWISAPPARLLDALLHLVDASLAPLIHGLARRPGVVFVGCAAAMWFAYAQFRDLGAELIPRVHQGEFTVEIALPIGTPIDSTAAAIRRVEQVLAEVPEIERFATVIGAERDTNRPSDEGEHTARLSVFLRATGDLASAEERVIERLRSRLSDIPGLASYRFGHPVLFTFRNPIEVEVQGHDLTLLRRMAAQVTENMSRIPGLRDVRSTLARGHPEMVIRYDRTRLAQYGLSPSQVAGAIRKKVQGEVATQLTEGDRQIEIVVRGREEESGTVERVRGLVVNPTAEIPLPLSAVADVTQEEGPSEVRRIGQQRAVVVSAQVAGFAVGRKIAEIEQTLRDLPRPDGFTLSLSGQNREMQVSIQSLWLALGLAAFLVYVVMASQFESLLHPLIIMLSLPLAFVGVAPVLHGLQISLSIVVFLGMIVLAGIVVNNAIVLVDYANQLRDRGMPPVEAVARSASVRLRPILMTTLTTVLGLLPMGLGLGEGTEVRVPMAITIIAGLSMSTILTLVVIPVIYARVTSAAPPPPDGRQG